jgi:hypothetical protein
MTTDRTSPAGALASRPAVKAPAPAVTAAGAADSTPRHQDEDDDWEAEAMHYDQSQAGPAVSDGLLLVPDAALRLQRGRAPAMAFRPWFTGQGVGLGAVTEREWYWRCPLCRAWAGPCADRRPARQAALDHRHDAHDRPAALRTEARKAARRVCKDMTAARLDEITARLTAEHGLTSADVHNAISRVAEAIGGLHSTHDQALFYTGKDLGTARDGDYLNEPHPRVLALAGAIAAELGHPGWLTEQMAADAVRRQNYRTNREPDGDRDA